MPLPSSSMQPHLVPLAPDVLLQLRLAGERLAAQPTCRALFGREQWHGRVRTAHPSIPAASCARHTPFLTSSSTGGGLCSGGLPCATAGPRRCARSFWRCFLPRVCSSSCAALVNLRPQVTHTGLSPPAAASSAVGSSSLAAGALRFAFFFRGASSSPSAARAGRLSGGGSGGTASPRWWVASRV